MTPGPIQMPNLRLAHAMITAGIPLASGEDGGPATNYYTPGLLRDRRVIPADTLGRPIGVKPEEFERRVLEMAEAGRAGAVTFFFQRTREAENFIKIWDETAEAIKLHREREKMTDEEKTQLDPLPKLPEIHADFVARVLCIHANNAETCARLPFVNPPLCNTLAGKFVPAVNRLGDHQVMDGGVTSGERTGAGKIWSVNLPDHDPNPDNPDRGKMKLHPRIRIYKNPYAT